MPRDTERLGRSGEYIVAAYLSLYSDTVSIIPHGSHADIIAEFEDQLLKFRLSLSQCKGVNIRQNKIEKIRPGVVGLWI